MRKMWLAASFLVCALCASEQVNAAEVRQVGAMSGALGQLKASVTQVAPETVDALGHQIAQALGLDPGSSFVLQKESALPNGIGKTLRYNQTYRGIPIWSQQVVADQSADGSIVGLEGQAVFGIGPEASGTPVGKINAEEALRKAKEITVGQGLEATKSVFENEKAELVYFLDNAGNLKLAYAATFFTTVVDQSGGDRPTRPVFIIDADTGETLFTFDNIQYIDSGTGAGGNLKTGKYNYGTGLLPKFAVTVNGSNCAMDDPILKTENLNHATSGPGTPFSYTCFENTVKEINGAYSPLDDAQSFGRVVFGMFKDWYNTSPLNVKLHLRVHYSNSFENAFWNGQTMTFGDGATRFHPLVSMDVTSHEIAHGFTEQHSGLVYANQSGGMNEAFSDMAGEAAEYYYVNKYGNPFVRPMPDLETGADIFKQAGKALRYMCDPPLDGRSIGHVSNYQPGMDVHYSSGVYNKTFCLLSKRPGWNIKKAFDVFVVANQSYWTPNETFQTGAEKVLKAAQLLGYAQADVIWSFKQVGIDLGPVKNQYFYNSLRVIADGASRGCSSGNWNCMTNLCKVDLGANAWRGWAGCWQKSGKFICYFECSRVAKFF
jgi:vibriolysin